jgi:gamma-glutamyltranspeptidase/glutathione hydrolase
MSLAFADRDFYYGDRFPPEDPCGPASKEYARGSATRDARGPERPRRAPRRSLPLPGPGANPFKPVLDAWHTCRGSDTATSRADRVGEMNYDEAFHAAPHRVIAADEEGFVVSVTPSERVEPRARRRPHSASACSQRAQSFVTDANDGPFNVIAPGQAGRASRSRPDAVDEGRGPPRTPRVRGPGAATPRTRTCCSSS